MFDASALQDIVRGYVREALMAAGLSIGGWIVFFPLKTFVKSVQDKWAGQTKFLSDIQTELREQRTNCLTTLQTQSKEQVELLTKAVEVLEDIHSSQAEMSGFLKGLNSK